jgi:hypothetical protein
MLWDVVGDASVRTCTAGATLRRQHQSRGELNATRSYARIARDVGIRRLLHWFARPRALLARTAVRRLKCPPRGGTLDENE